MDGQQTRKVMAKAQLAFGQLSSKTIYVYQLVFAQTTFLDDNFFLNIFYTCMKGHNTPHYHKTIKL
jgi:hypothetical protein